MATVATSPLAVLADPGPRYPAGSTAQAYTARKAAIYTSGAVLWLAVPAAVAQFTDHSVTLALLNTTATLIAARRVTHIAGRSIRETTDAIKSRPVLVLLPAAVLAAVAAYPLLDVGGFIPAALTTAGGAVLASAAVQVLIRFADKARRVERLIVEALHVVFRVPADVARASLRRRKDGSYVLSPIPAVARAAGADVAEVDGKLAEVLPNHEAVIDIPNDTLTLKAASDATQKKRELIKSSEGLVFAVNDEIEGSLNITLSPGVSPARAEHIQAWGRTVLADPEAILVQWEPAERRAIVRSASSAEARVRARVAALLKIQHPWELEIDTALHESGRLDRVVIHRTPPAFSGGLTRDERLDFWRRVAQSIPDGTNGWTAEETEDGEVTLSWGPARSLRPLVPATDLLPQEVSPDDWSKLVFGISERGDAALLDLELGPHVLVVGPTGSGKTIALVTLMAAQLARGHRVILSDAVKRAVDFRPLFPFLSGIAETPEETLAVLESAHAEGQRRAQVLVEHGAVKWSDLPEDVREQENIHPISIVIDEAASLLGAVKVPSSLPKDHPKREQIEALAVTKALLLMQLGENARELRFVGIFLVLALQRPDATILSGEVRANFTSIVQLSPPSKIPSRTALGMVFDSESVLEVAETLYALADGKSRGLAVIDTDGGSVVGLRVGYAATDDYPELLDRIGVPRNPWQLPVADAAGEPATPRFGERIETFDDTEEVVEEITFEMEDLVLPDDDDSPALPAADDYSDLFEEQ